MRLSAIEVFAGPTPVGGHPELSEKDVTQPYLPNLTALCLRWQPTPSARLTADLGANLAEPMYSTMDIIRGATQGRTMFSIVLAWEGFKDWLSATVHLSHHDLHLILGLALTLGLGPVLRRPLGSWLPLFIVFALELLNETSDFVRYYVSNWPWTPRETLIDIAITILPVLPIVLAARWETRRSRRLQPQHG
jgi:hypothetical protein